MRVVTLGTGTPIPSGRGGPSVLVEVNGERLLLDAGRNAVRSLLAAGGDPITLAAVFLTHHHYDHISDLDDVVMTAYGFNFGWRRVTPLPVYGPAGTFELARSLFDGFLGPDLRARSLEIQQDVGWTDVVDVSELKSGERVDSPTGWSVTARAVGHTGEGCGLPFESCLAFRITAGDESFVYAGDAGYSRELVELATGADTLLMCGAWSTEVVNSYPVGGPPEGFAADGHEPGRVADEAGVKRLVITHWDRDVPLGSALGEAQEETSAEVLLAEDMLVIHGAEQRGGSGRGDTR